MSALSDILLNPPIPERLLHALLFVAFTFHFVFVLFLIGTSLIGVSLLVAALAGGRVKDDGWHAEVLRSFLAHKSLAVVLGVAALLLIQVGFTVPFFTAVNLLAPFFMLIIALLIVAFVLMDTAAHRGALHASLRFVLAVVALAAILIVPGIFVAVLVVSENPAAWTTVLRRGYVLYGELAWHWLARYLHVLGAAIVFGAGFHYFFSSRGDAARRKAMLQWVLIGLAFQVVAGVALFASLPHSPPLPATVTMLAGITAAMLAGGAGIRSLVRERLPEGTLLIVLLFAVLIPMLVTRQLLQNAVYFPLNESLEANARAYRADLAPYRETALAEYRADLESAYDSGAAVYEKSCAFCHGAEGDGQGRDARRLGVAPEKLAGVRMTRGYLRGVLEAGVPGSGMPYFTYYVRPVLDDLMDHLDARFRVTGRPARAASGQAVEPPGSAVRVYRTTCSTCHGRDGRPTAFARGLAPRPPDFNVFNPRPKRAMEVITHGYPGTMMVAFGRLPEDVRAGLVGIVNGFFEREEEGR